MTNQNPVGVIAILLCLLVVAFAQQTNYQTVKDLNWEITAESNSPFGTKISVSGRGELPMLGTYSNTLVGLSGNTTIMPSAAPVNATSINVSTHTSFIGTLTAEPATGVIRVTDARPAGIYTVTVKAFGPSGTATATFDLTVTDGNACVAGSSFSPSTNFGVGTNPYGVTVGDFNGDGKQDLAAANFSLANVTILLGNGTGGFQEAVGSPIGVGANPEYSTVGDFNGDGKQDLAVANAGTSNVTILMGSGNGGFVEAPGSPVGAGTSARSVAVGDFNSDGKQDIVVGWAGGSHVSILLGNGNGGFNETSIGGVQAFPAYIAVGDFNGDGKHDVAVANGGSDSVTILLGDGNGGFNTAALINVGTQPLSIAVGNFNSDSVQDILVGNAASDNMMVLLGDGIGGFNPTSNSPVSTGSTPRAVVVGDFNADGKQDAALANHTVGKATILLGNGGGGFNPASFSPVTVGVTPVSVAVGDFNGDGKQDLAVANVNSDNISILIGGCLAPTAANVLVSGRVVTATGAGVRNAIVTLTGSQGVERTARSSSFGYYHFDDVQVGETYVIGVASKRHMFTPRMITVLDELTDVDFVAEPQ